MRTQENASSQYLPGNRQLSVNLLRVKESVYIVLNFPFEIVSENNIFPVGALNLLPQCLVLNYFLISTAAGRHEVNTNLCPSTVIVNPDLIMQLLVVSASIRHELTHNARRASEEEEMLGEIVIWAGIELNVMFEETKETITQSRT
jgi:hypothetical protein